ncbi:unnamed protein product [Paramecium sonneborni]|uniref:Uncharacterized protein n=1 Tax=Paramecium sonneborni TaxID=65129 RepID=A0A8S1L3Z1_9CILI|nr:unnamed protein product [Paramecium sonneborni]
MIQIFNNVINNVEIIKKYAFNCQIGFINQNDQCLPICGDGLKHGNEECDDNNNILDDGCYNCRFQCPKECLTCNELTTFPCLNLCGDGILSGEEECDDGNSIQFDGCYQCKIECQNQCTLCMRGLCYQCQTYGWIVEIDSKTCIENCGDLITIGREQCDDGLDDNQNDGCYQCKRVCRNDCLTCSSNGQTCLECKIVGFRPFSYYCRNICGDGYLAIDPFDRNSEECDDFNLTNFDGCSSTCKFQCQSNVCKTCVNNKCIECIDNYYLNQNQNKCIEQCNDNIIIGSEICEDMNSLLYDGCYNCQLSCQSSCSNCTINGCLSCFQGYQLVGIHCKPICGDKLIVIQEDCDDGNLIPFDGCHFCKYSCSQHCHTCYNGQCIMCQHNYIRYNGLCVQTIQFNQIFKIYSHSINLDQFIQNKPSNAFYEFCKEVINDICIVCQEFYSLNVISNCQSQCGDNIISGYEQCEDSITQNNIVCNECQLVCSDNCIYCQFGICLQCGEGYYLKLINNICEPIKQCTDIGLYYDIENNLCFDICGDGIKSKQELCDDDNDDPYDGCYKCQYSCLPNCPLCIQGQCVDDGNTCNEGYYFDTQKAECYNICGDGILSLPDEDCDNGTLFNIQDDQCQNCKIICAKSCQVCNLNNQCISCKKNYELLDGKCYPKDFNQHLCKIDNCDYCEDTQCITCSIGFTYHIIQNECQPICGDGIIIDKEQCDDGNLINGDGCDQNCQPSQDSQCVNNQCVPIQYPVPLLKFEKEIDNSQIVYLTFDQQVKLSFNYSIPLFIKSINTFLDDKAINVTFNEISTLNQEQLSNLQIQIIINFQEISNNPIFSIQFSDLNIIINEFGITSNHQNVSIQLPSPNFLSQKQQQLTASLVKFSTYQIQIIAGLILASSLSGKFEIIQNQIDLIQQLYYLKYINTRKGQNLIKFFGTFKIIQLASFYQFIGFNPSNDLFFNFSFQKSESIFEEDGRNANYLSNFISILTIFVFAYFTHLSIQLLIKYFMNHIKSLNIINFNKYQLYGLLKITKFSIKNCRNKFHNQFKGLLQSLIYEYIISSFLSLIYQDFNSAEGRLSFIANGIMQYLLINYLLSQEYQKQKSYSQFTYSCIQKMLFGIILIVCFKSAIIQIQLCTLNEFFYFYYLYQQKKQLDKLESFKKQFLHFNLFIINLFFLINEVYRNDTEKILYYGWVIIALMSFILSITLFIDIFKITSPFILKIISYIKAQKPQFINHEIFDQPEQQRQLF